MIRNKISYAKMFINGSELTYQIRLSRKAKYLQLRITSSNELELIIPKRYSINEGEKFIHGKVDWIKKYQKNLNHLPGKKEFYMSGEKIIIRQNFNFFLKKHKIRFKENILFIESPAESKITLEEIYHLYLKKIAWEYFYKRTQYLSKIYGFNFKTIKIRGQKTRWGSCSSKGSLSFNYKLLQFKKEVIDYVIIHELCHTKELNHSSKFWKLMERFCPDYKILKKELRSLNLQG